MEGNDLDMTDQAVLRHVEADEEGKREGMEDEGEKDVQEGQTEKEGGPEIVSATTRPIQGTTHDNDNEYNDNDLRLQTTPQLLALFDQKLPQHAYHTSFPIRLLRDKTLGLSDLRSLLAGTSVFFAPPKAETKVDEAYEARMRALRDRMAERDYQSLIEQDPHSSLAATRMELRTLRNQLSTVVNVLLSIFTAAMAAWFWTPHWRVGNRVLAALGSALGLGAIEAFLYYRFLVKIEQGRRYDKGLTGPSKVKKVFDTSFVSSSSGEQVSLDEGSVESKKQR